MLRVVGYMLVIAVLQAGQAKAVAIAGAGAYGCISLTNDRALSTNGPNPFQIQPDLQWVLGFIAALSLEAGVEGLGDGSPGVVFDQVEGTCSVHPDWSIAKATVEIFNRLGLPPHPMSLER